MYTPLQVCGRIGSLFPQNLYVCMQAGMSELRCVEMHVCLDTWFIWSLSLCRKEMDLNVPFFIWLPSCSLNIYEKFIFSPTSQKKDVYDTWWCSWVPSHEVNPRRIRCFKSPKASCLWATSVSLSQFPKVAGPHPVHLGLGESVCSLITMNFPLFLSSCTNLCQAGSEHPKETFLY